MPIIYVLQLQENKYYVGQTSNLEKRITDHQSGYGPSWIKKYPMIKLIHHFEGSPYDEDKTVLEYMSHYGADNVRGGIYSNSRLTFDQHILLHKQINHAQGKCIACGSDDHLIQNCVTKICLRCGRPTHNANDCDWDIHYLSGRLDGCYRCGRPDHWAIRCNRTYDIFGRKIRLPMGVFSVLKSYFWG